MSFFPRVRMLLPAMHRMRYVSQFANCHYFSLGALLQSEIYAISTLARKLHSIAATFRIAML